MTLLTWEILLKFSGIVTGCFWKLYFKFHLNMSNLQKKIWLFLLWLHLFFCLVYYFFKEDTHCHWQIHWQIHTSLWTGAVDDFYNQVKTRKPCSSKLKHKMSQCMLIKSRLLSSSFVLTWPHEYLKKYPFKIWTNMFFNTI